MSNEFLGVETITLVYDNRRNDLPHSYRTTDFGQRIKQLGVFSGGSHGQAQAAGAAGLGGAVPDHDAPGPQLVVDHCGIYVEAHEQEIGIRWKNTFHDG